MTSEGIYDARTLPEPLDVRLRHCGGGQWVISAAGTHQEVHWADLLAFVSELIAHTDTKNEQAADLAYCAAMLAAGCPTRFDKYYEPICIASPETWERIDPEDKEANAEHRQQEREAMAKAEAWAKQHSAKRGADKRRKPRRHRR